MDSFVALLKEINAAQIFIIICGIWFFYTRLTKKMDDSFRKVDLRFDKLEEKVTDIDRRLCRLEGAFSNKECCMIKDERHLRKVE
jgi:hypothetical protein